MATKQKEEKREPLKIEERFDIWSEYLCKPEGVTQNEIEDVYFAKDDSKKEAFKISSNLRKDLEHIRRLLKWKGITLIEEGKRNKRLRIEEPVDLKKLLAEEKIAQPYKDLLNVLLKSKGLLPESFLQDICGTYKEISENVDQPKSISFDADYDCMSSLEVFSFIYRAINKTAIEISHHPVNKPDQVVEGILYPEYLKQYQSNWYAFGMFVAKEGAPEFLKLPLNNISRYGEVDSKEYPFIKSSIEDYEEYFDDIIGVDNPAQNEVESIKFRISNRMYQRLRNKPLHPTQKNCKEIDSPGFKGMEICVKYNIELMRTILRLGADIEIVEPAHIRKRVIKELNKTLRQYKEI